MLQTLEARRPGPLSESSSGVAVRMHRQGYDLQLTQYDERGWRATFYTMGMEHSPTSAIGTGWEPTPWRAVQRAAWDALKGAETGGLLGRARGWALHQGAA
jgi:hypothetical protein